jgi:hypothetical protein
MRRLALIALLCLPSLAWGQTIRAGFPVVADCASAAPPYNCTSASFTTQPGDEIAAIATSHCLPTVVSRNAADSGTGVLNWILRGVVRTDPLVTSVDTEGCLQTALYTAIVPAGASITERARFTVQNPCNAGGENMVGNANARLVILAADGTSGVGAIRWKGSIGAGAGQPNDLTTGQAATVSIKPFAASSLIVAGGAVWNGSTPTPASGSTEIVAPGTSRMPVYSRTGGTAGVPVDIGSAVTDSTAWEWVAFEFLPTSTARPWRKLLCLGDSGIESTDAAYSTCAFVQDMLGGTISIYGQGVWWSQTWQARALWEAERNWAPFFDYAIVQTGMNNVSYSPYSITGTQTSGTTGTQDLASIYSDLSTRGTKIIGYGGISPLVTVANCTSAAQPYIDLRDWVTANLPGGSLVTNIDWLYDPAAAYCATLAQYSTPDNNHIAAAGESLKAQHIAGWIAQSYNHFVGKRALH